MNIRGRALLLAGLVALALCISPAVGRAENAETDCGNTSGYQPGSPWPAYHRCSTRLGLTGVHGPATPTLNWKANLGANLDSPVVAADGTIYVGAGAQLVAVSPTGVQRWSTYAFGNIGSAPAIGADGTVYVVSLAGALVAVNPANGAVKWVYRGAWGRAINTSPLIDGTGTIYFVDSLNFAHAVAPNGVAKWVTLFPGPVFSSLTMSRDDTTLYIGSQLLGLRAVNASNGSIKWANIALMGERSTSVVGNDGTIYVGSFTGQLYALSPLDGKTKWVASHKVLLLDSWGPISVPPALAPSGNVVFGTDKGVVVALSPTGARLWELNPGGGAVTAGPIVDADGTIYVGTALNKVYAITAQGQQRWSYNAGCSVYSSPALGAQGTLYIGSNDNYLYSLGVGQSDAFATPIATQPAQPVDVGGTGGTNNGSNPLDPTVAYCSDPALKSPATLIAQASPMQGWMTPRPGLSSTYSSAAPNPHFSVTGIAASGSACSAHLCSSDTGVQLSAADESLLLSDSATPQNIPARLFVPCEALSSRTSCSTPDYTKVHYDLPCSQTSPCPTNAAYVCAAVCPEDPASAASGPVGRPLAQCQLDATTADQQQSYCVAVVQEAGCAEQLASDSNCITVQECTRPEDVLTAADVQAMCTQVVTNPSTGQTTTTQVPCESLDQSGPVTAPPPKLELLAQYDDSATAKLLDPTRDIAEVCQIGQLEKADKQDNGGSPTHPGGAKKWGIDMDASFKTEYHANPGPFGIAYPHADAHANFDIIGRVWGRSIDVLTLNASATADLQSAEIRSDATAKIFGQTIAKVTEGANLQGTFGSSSVQTPGDVMKGVNHELDKVGATAKAQLAQLLRVYDQVIKAPNGLPAITPAARTITRDLCKKALKSVQTALPNTEIVGAHAQALAQKYGPTLGLHYDGTHLLDRDNAPILVDAICDAPLNQATAKLVMNKLINNYTGAVQGIDKEFDHIFESVPSADSPYFSSPWSDFTKSVSDYDTAALAAHKPTFDTNHNGYKSAGTIAGDPQHFSILGAQATFPIGPLALVLEIQGSGLWGINGQIDYGFDYDLQHHSTPGSTPVSAFANASVVPYAGVSVDLFVGVGVDIGIAGASVGIDGELTLVTVSVPVGGGLTLKVTNDGTEPSTRAWPAALQHLQTLGQAITPTKYKVTLDGQVKAGVKFAALEGKLGLAVRVHLLFLHKTWKKQIAELPGFQKTFQWVGKFSTGVNFKLPGDPGAVGELAGVVMKSPDLSVLPSIPFPSIPTIQQLADFAGLSSKLKAIDALGNLVDLDLPLTDDPAALASTLLNNADYFQNGAWLPINGTDPWNGLAGAYGYPAGAAADAIRGAVDAATQKITDFSSVPATCALTTQVTPI